LGTLSFNTWLGEAESIERRRTAFQRLDERLVDSDATA